MDSARDRVAAGCRFAADGQARRGRFVFGAAAANPRDGDAPRRGARHLGCGHHRGAPRARGPLRSSRPDGHRSEKADDQRRALPPGVLKQADHRRRHPHADGRRQVEADRPRGQIHSGVQELQGRAGDRARRRPHVRSAARRRRPLLPGPRESRYHHHRPADAHLRSGHRRHHQRGFPESPEDPEAGGHAGRLHPSTGRPAARFPARHRNGATAARLGSTPWAALSRSLPGRRSTNFCDSGYSILWP